MDIFVTRTEFLNGREVVAGEEWVQDTGDLALRGIVRCVAVNPARYVGIIRWAGVALVETAECPDADGAWRAAQREFARQAQRAFGP
jgi:hypothetical protein